MSFSIIPQLFPDIFTIFRCHCIALSPPGDLVLRRSPTPPAPTASLPELIFPFASSKRRPSLLLILYRERLKTIPLISIHVANIPGELEPASPWRRLRHSLEHSGDSASPSRARRRSLPSSDLPPSASRILSTTSLESLPSLSHLPTRPKSLFRSARNPRSSVSLNGAAAA